MAVSVETTGEQSQCKISISEDFTIYTAERIKDELDTAANDYNEFHLDLTEVEEIDSAAVQILLIWQKHLQDLEKKLLSVSFTGVVEKLFDDYGISSVFKLGESA